MAQSEKWSQDRAPSNGGHTVWGKQSGVRVDVCLVLAAGWGEPPARRAAFLWSFGNSLFPDCWLCLFSATQTLLGNGFSCQKNVINTATGCGLNNRLMVIFLKGPPAYVLCRHGTLHLSSLSARGLFRLHFYSFSHVICCSLSLPMTYPLDMLLDFREWMNGHDQGLSH